MKAIAPLPHLLALAVLVRIGPIPADAFLSVQPQHVIQQISAPSQRHPYVTQAFISSNLNPRTQYGYRASQSTTMHSSVSSIVSSTMETIAAFSKSNPSTLLDTVTQHALATPPVAYFLALLSAGCGIPVSEDALCLFCGAILWPSSEQRMRLLAALYAGVVLSDFVTFWIGRALRLGLFAPLAKRLKLNDHHIHGDDGDASQLVVKEKTSANEELTSNQVLMPTTSTTTTTTQRRLQQAGDWAGFMIRFSVGTRGPLMLLAGFSNQIPFAKFAIGASMGAAITLPLQLYAGCALGGRNPKAVVGLVAGMSSFVMAAAVVVATATWTSLLWSQLALSRRRRKTDAAAIASGIVNTTTGIG
ncbi:hypothetical protein MHU86_9872 [Fragilaria crotonensis]|nr:hypothetical protein MHU86_9872 [Fragilaria crotonensis]